MVHKFSLLMKYYINLNDKISVNVTLDDGVMRDVNE